MSDTYETKAALLAVKENCDLPVFVTLAFGEDGKLLSGASPEAAVALLDRIIDPSLMVRRINISVNNLVSESKRGEALANEQLDFFTDYEEQTKKRDAEQRRYNREKSRQNAVISIRKKFGGNAILKGMNLEDGATTIDRNKQIGGHKA
jgi:DNA polymerase V